MTDRRKKLTRIIAAGGAAAAFVVLPLSLTPGASAEVAPQTTHEAPTQSAGDGTPEGAIEWMQARQGDTSYEGYCEMAVENAYGTTGIWPSAIDHWYGAVDAGKAHPGDYSPPAGAFVYWNTSQYGHVGIADGQGGFYSSSINGAIGYSSDLDYFVNYLGWSDPQVPCC